MAIRIDITRMPRVKLKTPLSQRSLDSLRAANPTATNKTITSMLVMLNRMCPMAWSLINWDSVIDPDLKTIGEPTNLENRATSLDTG